MNVTINEQCWKQEYDAINTDDGILVSLTTHDPDHKEDTYRGKCLLIDRATFIRETKAFLEEIE